MSFLNKLTALMPFGKKEETLEYYFALNITLENLTCALWTIEQNHLKILDTAVSTYSSLDELLPVTDRLLDQVLGVRQIDPQKILFGVPSSWLMDENLKEEKLKILRGVVKELELTPMAYVESSHALIHLLEKIEGLPPTDILVGFEKKYITVTVVRAGKFDGVKTVIRGENSGTDIEKALLSFTSVETLPSKIMIYGENTAELKNQLLSYSWMSKLSFLHFPKIEIMPEHVEIKGICFAGASEIDSNVLYLEKTITQAPIKEHENLSKQEGLVDDQISGGDLEEPIEEEVQAKKSEQLQKEDLGFMVGDVSSKEIQKEDVVGEGLESGDTEEMMDEDYIKNNLSDELALPEETSVIETDDFENELAVDSPSGLPAHTGGIKESRKAFSFKNFFPKKSKRTFIGGAILGFLIILVAAFLLLPKAEVKIFAEPKILEKDATVTADPNQKTVDETNKIIPGQILETQVSSSAKGTATGQKEVGNPAKGTIVLYNKTFDNKTLSKGNILTSSNGLKFVLDSSVNIASQSATDSGITFGKTNSTVTASAVGADSNLASGSELNVSGFSSTQVSAKAEGNFSGGSSKTVTVVSSDDQNKLLASLASDLRKQAQQKLQDKLSQKKILEEALTEEIINKSFNKNINDQATEFSLNLTSKYKGTAFEDKDLKDIVSQLVVTQIPDGFRLSLEDTETQADVSKVEKGGKLIFLAKFKAKLMPKIDTESVANKIKGKSVSQAVSIIKGMENILDAEIKIKPSTPFLQMVPILSKNIKIEVGLK